MALQNLNHFLVLADDLAATRDFYVEVLGLRVGDRPPFPFPGFWLYLGDRPVVHLAAGGGEQSPSGSGPIDHIAFEATGHDAMVASLKQRGLAFSQRQVPDSPLRQIFLHDPNGVKIELNYPH